MEVRMYVLLAVGAMLLIGTADFVRRIAMSRGVSVFGFMAVESLLIALMALAAGWWLEGGVRITPVSALFSAAAGLLIFLGLAAFFTSLRTGDVSVVSPIVRLGFAVAAVLGIALLGEELTLRKALGLLFAGLAVYLLSG